nr:metallophosphoesterase family protein [Halorientalis brevis]
MTSEGTDGLTAHSQATTDGERLTGNTDRDLMLTDTDFADEVADRHLRFDAAQYDDIYVVGDVHGCIDELRTLWDRVDPSGDDVVLFVGDLIRKGPDSEAVVEFVQSRPNALSVRGNNEAKVINDRIDTGPFAAFEDGLEELPVVISWDDAMIVHGGVHPEWALADHDIVDFQEMRGVPVGNSYDGPYWFDSYQGPPRVFFGHTVLEDPVVREWAIGLDTGCVYGGDLTAYDYRSDEFVSVPAEETYRDRSDDKILDV